MKSSRGTFGMAALALLVLGAGPEPADAGQKALLIGAGAYPYLPDNAQLHGPRNDVRSMNTFLVREWGFSSSDIRVLEDEEATKQGMLDALRVWLPGATQPGDRVVVYFSGHGSRVPDENGDERDDMDETFMPTDFGRNGHRAEDMLLDDELADALARMRDRQVLLIADSCYSGTVTRSAQVDVFDRVPNARPRYFPFRPASRASRSVAVVRDEEPIAEDVDIHLTLSAALPHQLAWETDGAGIFTRYFIEALTDMRADLNGNGRLTSAELINYVKPRTERWCEQVKRCRDLEFTPNFDPKNETFVLQPVATGDDSPTVAEEDAGAVSDILPGLGDDAILIEIEPGNRHRIGDEVSFHLTSAMDGYVTLLDLNASDDLVLLFPTREDVKRGKAGRIRANHELTVPDKSYGVTFPAGPPIGRGQLIAIVTEDRVDLGSLLDEHRDFEPVEDKLGLMKSIAERLYAVWTGDEENRGARWAAGYVDYEIGDR